MSYCEYQISNGKIEERRLTNRQELRHVLGVNYQWLFMFNSKFGKNVLVLVNQ